MLRAVFEGWRVEGSGVSRRRLRIPSAVGCDPIREVGVASGDAWAVLLRLGVGRARARVRGRDLRGACAEAVGGRPDSPLFGFAILLGSGSGGGSGGWSLWLGFGVRYWSQSARAANRGSEARWVWGANIQRPRAGPSAPIGGSRWPLRRGPGARRARGVKLSLAELGSRRPRLEPASALGHSRPRPAGGRPARGWRPREQASRGPEPRRVPEPVDAMRPRPPDP